MSMAMAYKAHVEIDGHAVAASSFRIDHHDAGPRVTMTLAGETTLERQMALETLAGNEASACALADRLIECRKRDDGADVMGELIEAAKAALETMREGDFRNGVTTSMGDIDEGDVRSVRDMERLRFAIMAAEGRKP